MNDIEEYEGMRNLNPATDKLGRDRDFKDNTAKSLTWITDQINDMEQRLQIMEIIIKKMRKL